MNLPKKKKTYETHLKKKSTSDIDFFSYPQVFKVEVI